MNPVRGSLLTLGSQAAIAVLTFAATVVIGRTLGPESRGAIAAALLTPVLFGTLGCLGLGTATTYFVAREPARIGAIVGTGLAAAGALGALSLAVFGGATALHLLPSTTSCDGVALLALGAIAPAFLLHDLVANALRGDGRIAAWNAVYLVQSGTNVAVLAVLALGARLDVTTAIASTAASYFVSVSFGLVALRRSGLVRLTVDRALVGSLVRYGARAHVGSVVFFLNYRLDALLLQGIAGNYEAGIYATAVAPSEIVWMLGSAIAAVAFPRLAALSGDGIRKSTTRLLGCTFGLSLLVGAVAALVGPFAIVWAYGEAFRPAVTPFYWLLPGTILFSVVKLLWVHFAARDQALRVALVVGGATALDVALNLLLAAPFGASGSAVAASVSYALAAGTLLVLFAPPREWPAMVSSLRDDARRGLAIVLRGPIADRRA
ncbi:MAG: oligosaccharide flippase family protein [Planctomycetes bacterium]|nr:oligosaccharide flippase family protein [Planctomycetota bacterium]